jgi:fucose permease
VTAARERLYAVACAGMFVFGMILGLPGTVLGQPDTVAQFGLTLADRGLLISTLFAGLLIGSLLSGPLVDAMGQRAALILSSSLVALSLPLVAMASNAAVAELALFALGVASASINTASNALSSELFPDERGRRMNGIAIMVGIGGLAMPTVTVLASEFVSWRAVVVVGGMLSAVVAIVAAGVRPLDTSRLKGSAPTGNPTSTIAALRQFSRQPEFKWFLLLILLGGGNEASMAGWTSSFVLASGLSASVATLVLSSHWLGLILSRSFFSSRVDRAKAIAVERSAVLSALTLLVLVVSGSRSLVMIGPFMVGVCMALVMPTSLALAGERLRGNPGTLFGGLLTVAQVGGMLLPSSIGLVAEQTSIRLGLALLVGSFGAIALIVRRLASDGFRQPPEAE